MTAALSMRTTTPRPDPASERLVEWVRLGAQGDREAQQALLSALLPRVRNLVRYFTRSDADVDDIAQRALIELLRSLPGYRGEGAVEAWAHRITSRVALREARRRRLEWRRRNEHAVDLAVVRDVGAPPDEYIARREAVTWLDALPREQREAFVLHHVAGMSVPELAEMLQIPFETARSRLRLAARKLREQATQSGLQLGRKT
jgi:RNA polymerase sigma-70 factor (ECF subfamily)